MANVKKRKRSFYLPEEILKDISAEADRLDRSVSWVIQRAWSIAYPEIKKLQGNA